MLSSKVTVQAQTHTHTPPIALPGPLNWSVTKRDPVQGMVALSQLGFRRCRCHPKGDEVKRAYMGEIGQYSDSQKGSQAMSIVRNQRRKERRSGCKGHQALERDKDATKPTIDRQTVLQP